MGVHAALELGDVDVDQDIEEMADLCNELLNSDLATTSLIEPIVAFTRAVNAQPYQRHRLQPTHAPREGLWLPTRGDSAPTRSAPSFHRRCISIVSR
jgi:hypothetical protein